MKRFVLVCSLVAGLHGGHFVHASEQHLVKGISKPAEILVDRWGVPHIYAGAYYDAFFVQGFNAARDRLFQIDLWRRRGLGQLSEVFGEAFIERDRAARLFLYRGDMRAEWLAYGSDAKRIAEAFTAGVNAYVELIRQGRVPLPDEFRLMHYEPATWAAEDIVRIRSHGLTRNLVSEVARAQVACKIGVRYDAFRIGLTHGIEASVPEGLTPCDVPADVLHVFQLATQGVRFTRAELTAVAPVPADTRQASVEELTAEGSNNWAIAPARSATGRPILANDPHRAYSAPSLRYAAHLNAPGLDIIGAGEPALPGISLGHNGAIAFGLTIFSIDQEDLYVYETNPANPLEYRYQGRWEPMRVASEEVRVRGGMARKIEMQYTRHGPVIHVDRAHNRAFAVRSGWLEPGMSAYFSSIDYMRARDWNQFLGAMNRVGAPSLNYVYADTRGNIGWTPSGLMPVRSNWDGLMPVPGDGRYEWAGFRHRDELPQEFNPRRGWVATANQMNLPEGYPNLEKKIGFEWTNPARYRRIAEVLESRRKFSLEDSMRLQNDYVALPARRLTAVLKELPGLDDKAARAAALFAKWNHELRADSPAAALFEAWFARHLNLAYRNAVLPTGQAIAMARVDPEVILDSLEKPDGRLGANPAQTRASLMLTTLVAAYEELEKTQGSDPQKWQWGRVHHALFEHPMADALGDFGKSRFNVGPLPKGGSPYTPNQSSYRFNDGRLTNGPSFRMVLDVGNWDNSRAINTPGQSGDPASPHYRDLARDWLEGKYFPLLYTRKAIDPHVERVIRLRPAP